MYFCSWPENKYELYRQEKPRDYNTGSELFAPTPEEASDLFSNKYSAWTKEEFDQILKTIINKKQIIKEGIITYGLIDCYKVSLSLSKMFMRVYEKFKIWTILDSPEEFNDFSSLKMNLLYTEKK